MRRAAAAAVVTGAIAGALLLARARGGSDEGARCGSGFQPDGARCFAREPCPAPLVATSRGCDAPDVRVAIPGGAIAVGPSDWEAEGRVVARSIRVQPFRIDAFEVTRGAMGASGDVARAASNVTQTEALAFCATRGGRLPTEDEWIVAAASAMNPPRRYPWGDTGAVCRRAAWGLLTGPCAHQSDGPDTVGAHPDGDSPLAIHDLSGNVSEWVTTPIQTAPHPLPDPAPQEDSIAPRGGPAGGVPPPPRSDVAKGGNWATSLAADLRIWARLELPSGARDPRVGFRCVYP